MADLAEKLAAAIAKGYGMIAGDHVTHVTAAGQETSLLTIKYDVSAGDEGLDIGNAGMLLGSAQNLCFLTSYLDAMNVTLQETDHWMINDERWDYAMDVPIQAAVVPIAGVHNLVLVTIRKAAEINAVSCDVTPAVPGQVTGLELGPFTIATNTNDKFSVRVRTDGVWSSWQTVTFSPGTLTAQDVCDAINAGTDGVSATVSSLKVHIEAVDAEADIEIGEIDHDAYSTLGFAEDEYDHVDATTTPKTGEFTFE